MLLNHLGVAHCSLLSMLTNEENAPVWWNCFIFEVGCFSRWTPTDFYFCGYFTCLLQIASHSSKTHKYASVTGRSKCLSRMGKGSCPLVFIKVQGKKCLHWKIDTYLHVNSVWPGGNSTLTFFFRTRRI